MNKWNIEGVLRGQERRLEDILDLSAEIVEGEIKVRTPVDTGNLKSNTRWRKQGKLTRRVYNNTEYAIYVEFGTQYMEPQPYMRPGLAAAKPKIERMLRMA